MGLITFDNTQHGADLFDWKVEGNIYTRSMHPTTSVLAQRLAESGEIGGDHPSVWGAADGRQHSADISQALDAAG